MARNKGYVCPECGTHHDGLPTDQGFKLPDDVWAIPEPERAARALFDTDLCTLDDRFFIRCILYVPFQWNNTSFGWGIWAEVTEVTFVTYLAVYNQDASQEPPVQGTLANDLSVYPDAKRELVEIRFGNATSRPTLHTQATSMTSLAIEQRDGIDQRRYHDILNAIGATST